MRSRPNTEVGLRVKDNPVVLWVWRILIHPYFVGFVSL